MSQKNKIHFGKQDIYMFEIFFNNNLLYIKVIYLYLSQIWINCDKLLYLHSNLLL